MEIPDKSTGDAYSASELTQFKNETQNSILMNGEALNAADTTQLGKSIQTSAGSGDFYSCVYISGSSVYSLTGPSGRQYPNEYKIGMRVRFEISDANLTTSERVRVGTLASTFISEDKVANGGPPTIAIGSMVAGNFIELIYDETPDQLTNYWRFVKIWGNQVDDESIGLEKLKSGSSPSLIDSRMLFRDSSGDVVANMDQLGISVSINGVGSINNHADGIWNYTESIPSLIERDTVIKINASAWTWAAEGSSFVSTPSASIGRIASSAIETGSYGAYSASIVVYSSTISNQITKIAEEVWVSLDSNGDGTLEKIYIKTAMPSPAAGAYCYIRLSRKPV